MTFSKTSFGDTEFLRLLRDLLFDKRRFYETWTDDIRPHAMGGPLLGDDAGKAEKAVFRGYVGRFEGRGFLRVDGAHEDD